MKKFTFLFIFLFTSAFVFSQWQFGPRVGINFSTVSGQWTDDENDHSWITGFVVGGIGNYSVNDNFSVQGELLYITSGAKYEYTIYESARSANSDYNAYGIERYGNLRLPILARFTFGEVYQFYGLFGPYFNYILCGKYKDVAESFDYEEKGKIKFGDEPDNYDGDDWYINNQDWFKARRFDVGLNIGIGAQRPMGNGKIAVDFRFGMGFLDFYKYEDNDDKPDDYKPYLNRNLNLSIAYLLPCN